MILTVLGANGPFPAPGGACSGYLLTSDTGNTNVLIDCGAGVLSNLYRFLPLEALDAVVLSHLHYDHMSDMLPMRYALDCSERTRLDVFAPREPQGTRALLENCKYVLREPTDRSIGEFSFRFAKAAHPAPCVSMAVREKESLFVYTADTNEHDALEGFCGGANLLLADAGLLERDWKATAPHLSALRCGRLAKNARAERLVLTHLSPRYAPEEALCEARREYPAAELAETGKRYLL